MRQRFSLREGRCVHEETVLRLNRLGKAEKLKGAARKGSGKARSEVGRRRPRRAERE